MKHVHTEGVFLEYIKSADLVLVDFFATWCAPCKKMKPELEALATDFEDDIEVIRIDVDQNRTLSEELGIISLPVVQIYKNSELKWTKTGYSDKVTLKSEIEKLK